MVVVALALAGWFAYSRSVAPSIGEAANFEESEAESAASFLPERSTQYSCDGREYCSQMTSCEEAEFFLRNCPDAKMDGNNDGVPCELQWCGD
jgi:hypothetical protein